jgi:hypothetical protein
MESEMKWFTMLLMISLIPFWLSLHVIEGSNWI